MLIRIAGTGNSMSVAEPAGLHLFDRHRLVGCRYSRTARHQARLHRFARPYRLAGVHFQDRRLKRLINLRKFGLDLARLQLRRLNPGRKELGIIRLGRHNRLNRGSHLRHFRRSGRLGFRRLRYIDHRPAHVRHHVHRPRNHSLWKEHGKSDDQGHQANLNEQADA